MQVTGQSALPVLQSVERSFAWYANGGDRDTTFACRMRRENLRHIVIIERQSGCAALPCISRQIHFAADDCGFHLRRAIASIAKLVEQSVQVCHKKQRNAGIASESLLK